MDFSKPLEVNRDMHAPIEEYRDLLNYVSKVYGTPISARVVEEYDRLRQLERIYSNIFGDLTYKISEGKQSVSPSARKYSAMQFEVDYMDVPRHLVLKRGSISSDEGSRDKVDIESPNFMNSIFSLWSDINSRCRIKDFAERIEFIEDKRDAFGKQLAVIRPSYSIKDTTMRITTEKPNLQGMSTLYKKEYLVAEDGRKLVGADISSQEATIFFNGLCYDEDIIRMFMEVGEIYRPVVAKIEGIPVHQVDDQLRKTYKVGILSKMNNAGIDLLSSKMGSQELAMKLNRFIATNPSYSEFLQSVERQLLTPEPRMGGFLNGRYRVLKTNNYKSRNQLINAPLQITAVCFMSISIFAFIERMMREIGDWNSMEEFLEDVRPTLHAHDEVVWSVADKKGYVEYAKECLAWALGVKFEKWVAMKAEPYADIKYHH